MNQTLKNDSLQKSTWRLWTRDSSVLLSAVIFIILLVIYFWWPLAKGAFYYVDWNGSWWLQLDWLLVGIFAFMTLVIIIHANLKTDALLIFTATCGGLVIESWGTQTNLWFYFTAERPPLWIIPAWPIASVAINRLADGLDYMINKFTSKAKLELLFKYLYWLIFIIFIALMLNFVAPTFDKSFTVLAIMLCLILILTPINHRFTVLTFIAGAGLGYFLELWGTTRKCWTYYTFQTPPLFAILAHGMASVAFWRAGMIMQTIHKKLNYQKLALTAKMSS